MAICTITPRLFTLLPRSLFRSNAIDAGQTGRFRRHSAIFGKIDLVDANHAITAGCLLVRLAALKCLRTFITSKVFDVVIAIKIANGRYRIDGPC
jgi:hypothetical protein